jgi:hypothetical protein
MQRRGRIGIAAIFITAALDAAIFPAKDWLAKIVVGTIFLGRLGRRGRAGFTGRGAEIRQNGLLLNLSLAQGGQIVGHRFFFVESDLTGVSANETFVEDAAGKLIKMFVFEGAQHAGADFGAIGDGIEGDAPLLALLAKFFPERSHDGLRRAGLSFRPYSRREIIIGEGGHMRHMT